MGLGCASSLLFLPHFPQLLQHRQWLQRRAGDGEELAEREQAAVPGAAGEEVEEQDDVTSCGGADVAAAGDGDEASPQAGGSGWAGGCGGAAALPPHLHVQFHWDHLCGSLSPFHTSMRCLQ